MTFPQERLRVDGSDTGKFGTLQYEQTTHTTSTPKGSEKTKTCSKQMSNVK